MIVSPGLLQLLEATGKHVTYWTTAAAAWY